jgi:8-oxo-dGTP pyrophosphatase MutT (NUDIX family)
MPDLTEFFALLKHQLSLELPGESSQQHFSGNPSYSTSLLLKQNPSYRKSAVLILLWPQNEQVRSLLIRRPIYPGVHSGQIAFPGGRYEPSDIDLMDTSIREAREEIGVSVNRNQVIGKLSPLYIPPSNFMVQPYIGLLAEQPMYSPDEKEVDAVIEFNLLDILNPSLLRSSERILSDGRKAETPYYDLGGSEVWGATALILSELAILVKQAISF